MGGAAGLLPGVYAPVVTPFRGDEIAVDALRANLRALRESPLAGFFALGSNGEARSMSWDEHRAVMEVFAAETAGRVVMVGAGCESTSETIMRAREIGRMGFSYASVITPAYFASRMNDETLQSHYLRVADASPVPVLIYNAPGFAGGVNVSPAVVQRLAAHPNIAGIKDSAPAGPGRYLAVLDPRADFRVLAGSIAFFYPSLLLGATGGVLSLANSLPGPCAELFELAAAGRHAEARALHGRLVRLNAASSDRHGVAGVKALMDLTGYAGLEPRRPLAPLAEAHKADLAAALAREGFASQQRTGGTR
jgi:4-hydroxy-2-oxoglutarate aldolase